MSLADVDAITITDYRYYKKIQTNESVVLSQFLVQGTANLFSWNKKFFLEKDEKQYALETEEIRVGTSIHRKKTYMGILKSVMIDCPSIQNRLNRVQLTETSLSEIVEDYNICIGAKPFIFKAEIPLFRITISPLIGVSYTNLAVSYPKQFYYVYGFFDSMNFKEINISPGIGFNLYSPRIDDRVSLYVEARYLKTTFNERVISPNATLDDNEIKFSYSYLYLPVMIQNDIPIRINQSIYYKLGLLLSLNLSNDYEHIKRSTNVPNSNPIVDDTNFDYYPTQLGFTGGVGYKMKIGEKINYFTEFRFDNQGVLANSSTINFDPYIFSLFFGVSF